MARSKRASPNKAVQEFKQVSEEVIGEIYRAPYTGDEGDRFRYLSFRFLGFSMREAINLAHITYNQVQLWYKDDKSFYDLDKYKLPRLRQQESLNWMTDIWEQNFQLLAARDRWVFQKAYLDPDMLTEPEKKWLEARHKLYTPESLARLRVTRNLVQPQKLGDRTSFQELVMSMQKNQELRVKYGVAGKGTIETQKGTSEEEPEEIEQDAGFELIQEEPGSEA